MSRAAAAPQEPGPRSWERRNREVVALGLEWARQALAAHIQRLRSSAPARGFAAGDVEVTSDLEADWLLRELAGPADATPIAGGELDSARAALDSARAAMRRSGEPAAIDRLAELFGLAQFDQDLLLLALAPHLEAGFQALFGYAHDRTSLTRPTPHLALALLADGDEARFRARDRLAPAAPLRRFALIQVEEGSGGALAQLALDERVAGYLLGRDELDGSVRACLYPAAGGPLPERHAAAVEALAAKLDGSRRPAAMILGPPRCGRRAAAAALAGRFELGLAELEPRVLPADPVARRARFAVIAREAHLTGFAVAIDLGPDAGAPGDGLPVRELAEAACVDLDALVILLAQDRVRLRVELPSVRLSALTPADRVSLWKRALGTVTPEVEETVEAVAEQFALGPAEIAAIAGESPAAGDGALWSACREAAGRGLGALGERIEPHFDWDDIVLPESVRHDLRALAGQVRHRARVYGHWGFDSRLPRGRGVTALFAGPSGVGKTMAAEVIAGELGLDLYRIDLSGVVSKYIGETEKNLHRVFDAAEAAGAVLFFDEADALFGKRTEVKDSHDRYANIEVSYLLQRMEAYTGLAILATNLKRHLDDAFLRRLRYVIDLPFPDAALRRAIWQRAFPAEAPVGELDLAALARLEVSGGNITVIAVNAAFLAAADRRPIDMGHVARATRAEFHKLDKELRLPWAEEG